MNETFIAFKSHSFCGLGFSHLQIVIVFFVLKICSAYKITFPCRSATMLSDKVKTLCDEISTEKIVFERQEAKSLLEYANR